MLPIASNIATNAMRDQVGSALPNAPVVTDEPARESRTRIWIASFLRSSAKRRVRLADRIDPCSGRVEPATG
jgi:hypothetical protein